MNDLRVRVLIGDPWELGEELGWPQPTGTIIRWSQEPNESALIQLDTKLHAYGTEWTLLLVTPRHVGGRIADIADTGELNCNAVGLTHLDELANGEYLAPPAGAARLEMSCGVYRTRPASSAGSVKRLLKGCVRPILIGIAVAGLAALARYSFSDVYKVVPRSVANAAVLTLVLGLLIWILWRVLGRWRDHE